MTTTDGVGIAYRDHGGAGRPLVLLHGGGGNFETMDPYAERLPKAIGWSRWTRAVA